MYLLGEQPAYADKLINRLKAIPRELLEGLQPCAEPIEIEQCTNLSSLLPNHHLFLIDSGLIHTFIDSRPFFYLQEGDLLGLRQDFEFPAYQYSSEETIRLLPYERRDVFKHIAACSDRQELFTFYLLGHSALLTDALARLKQPEIRPATGFQSFAAGEELIHQGDIADNVFIIIEGHAEAWVNGEKVGDVEKDEIFGAMAVFTEERRNATVIASEPCTVMVIPKDQFLSLMHNNPRIAHSLIESMARRIDLMNQEITSLRHKLKDQESTD
ncbi:MAG: cyclic nucleotide-binding domain-containing protein [Gammaproteobacteria bacterium]|nr:cyclic nucleotide-binding domain-containing protein [Gammaproteobacteria bacterium]